MDLFETCSRDTALQDTEILFRVDIKRFVVNGLVIGGGGCLGRGRGRVLYEEGVLVRSARVWLVDGMVAVEVKLIRGRKQLHHPAR